MVAQGAEIVALDVSGVVIAKPRANALAGGVRLGLLRADIRDLPFARCW
jgi:hypothetical protein